MLTGVRNHIDKVKESIQSQLGTTKVKWVDVPVGIEIDYRERTIRKIISPINGLSTRKQSQTTDFLMSSLADNKYRELQKSAFDIIDSVVTAITPVTLLSSEYSNKSGLRCAVKVTKRSLPEE